MFDRTFSFTLLVLVSVSENTKSEENIFIFGHGGLCGARIPFRDFVGAQQPIHRSKPTNRRIVYE